MTVLPGLRPEPLASYLAGLGLIRVLAEQADRNLAAAWTPEGLAVTTTVEDIAGWLAGNYEPTPVVSPWNNGSGFGAKDKEPLRVLEGILAHPSSRFDQLRAAIQVARKVAARSHDDKAGLVRDFRNSCPESALPWIDATVVLANRDTLFPPLLGTGGNDGHLDFSTNFHQRLLDVIDTKRSRAMACDLLAGTEEEQLSKAAIGQFNPAGAGGPGSSKFGAADSLVNPWAYVLFVEGALMFAASTVRRNQFAAGRAAIPFTVSASPDGTDSGAAREETRGELWAPVWFRQLAYPEIRQLFTEARASWRGHQARRATDFYAATRTLGVARGIDRFTRFGLQRRNGLAFAAVPLATVDVRENPNVALAADVEDWAARFGNDAPAAVGQAARMFQRAHLEYVRDGDQDRLVHLLAELTSLEQAVGRSGRTRDNVPVRRPPNAAKFVPVLARDSTPEVRIAVGLASLAWLGSDGKYSNLRHLLLPIYQNGRWSPSPVIPGFGIRPLASVLADVLIYRCRTADADRGTVEAGRAEAVYRGVPGFRLGIPVPAADLHEFAAGRLDLAQLDLYLRACLALSWRDVQPGWTASDRVIPMPTLGMLQPLAAGLSASEGPSDEPRLAISPGWPARLIAGYVPEVHREAARRLKQAGWQAVSEPGYQSPAEGTRIAAALVPRCQAPRSVLSLVARKLKEQS
jgi:CRISPR-associated protein Csx17